MVDLTPLSRRQLKPIRRDMQVIFQDPFSSLNPRMTVLEIVGEPLVIHGMRDGGELRGTASRELLEMVGLRVQHMNRFPHAFSGGQRQRIGIARALALQPELIVCDEPVSALDVSIQAQVLNLLKDLQARARAGLPVHLTRPLVVEHISDRVAVMYLGGIVEIAPAEQFYEPQAPVHRGAALGRSRSRAAGGKAPIRLQGDVPNPANPPSGCYVSPPLPGTPRTSVRSSVPGCARLGRSIGRRVTSRRRSRWPAKRDEREDPLMARSLTCALDATRNKR